MNESGAKSPPCMRPRLGVCLRFAGKDAVLCALYRENSGAEKDIGSFLSVQNLYITALLWGLGFVSILLLSVLSIDAFKSKNYQQC